MRENWHSAQMFVVSSLNTCLEPCCIRQFLRPAELGEKGDRRHLSYPAQSNPREVKTAIASLPLIDSDNKSLRVGATKVAFLDGAKGCELIFAKCCVIFTELAFGRKTESQQTGRGKKSVCWRDENAHVS